MKGYKKIVSKCARLLAITTVVFMGIISIIASNGDDEDGTTPDPDTSSMVYISQLSFSPINSSTYNLECTQEHMNYAQDTKLFRPIIKLSSPAHEDFKTFFYIQEKGSLSNPTIGYFYASFERGHTEPSLITTPNDKETVEAFLGMNVNRMPVGAPIEETRGFWLGCTKSCNVRGNGPQGNAGRQNIYLSMPGLLPSWFTPPSPQSVTQVTSHQVECL